MSKRKSAKVRYYMSEARAVKRRDELRSMYPQHSFVVVNEGQGFRFCVAMRSTGAPAYALCA